MIPDFLTNLAFNYLKNPDFTEGVRFSIGIIVIGLIVWGLITYKLIMFWWEKRK